MPPANPSLPRHNGAAIRTFRELAGKRGVQLAEEVGCTTRHLRNLEKEQYGCSPELLARIAEALNVPVAAILRVQPDTERVA